MQLKTGLIAAMAMVLAHGAFAQEADSRMNPFEAPPSAAEQQLVQDERTRNIVREMQGEISEAVASKFDAKISALEVTLRRRIDTATQDLARQQGGAIPGASALMPDGSITGGEGAELPENSTFIACINGKALYRDSENSLFQIEGVGSGDDRCAR